MENIQTADESIVLIEERSDWSPLRRSNGGVRDQSQRSRVMLMGSEDKEGPNTGPLTSKVYLFTEAHWNFH